jgi:hypothetical protein
MKRQAPTLLALLTLTILPAPAGAEFTRATLLSGTAQSQFEEANEPALSQNGHYAAFRGTLAGHPGIYRLNLQTGEVQLVAAEKATAPSISANGRYIAFTTTAGLETVNPKDEPVGNIRPPEDSGCPAVYVADMEPPPPAHGPVYQLASALNESEEEIGFGGCTERSGPGFAIAGAQAAPDVALSADGRHVAFTVLGASNLTAASEECGELRKVECTPPSQVAVRDLETNTTTLVSATPAGRATPNGGAYPSSYSLVTVKNDHVENESSLPPFYGDQPTASTAAISADASTVAWLGTNVPEQVPSSAAEIEHGVRSPPPGMSDPLGSEAEPLWRRVADGKGAVTRRLLAGAGLNFFYSIGYSAQRALVSGSLIEEQGLAFVAPVLSANGETVALLSNAPSRAIEAGLLARVNPELFELNTDAYVVHVDDDPAVAPEVIPLTSLVSYDAPEDELSDIKDLAISPDGTRVAFDTSRTPLESPSLASISSSAIFTALPVIYEANLARGTLQRVSAAYDGSEPNGGAGLLSFSADDTTLAFASDATNLFFGDGVPAWEVYSAEELPTSLQPAPTQIGPAPAPLSVAPEWVLSATATAQRDGSVVLDAQVPGAGALGVRALAQLPAPAAHRAHAKTPGRARAKRAGRPGGSAHASLPTRAVAEAGAVAAGASQLVLHVKVGAAYHSLLSSRDGLYVVLRVTFTAPGHATLAREIPVTLRRIPSATSRSPEAVHRRVTLRTHRHGTSGTRG